MLIVFIGIDSLDSIGTHGEAEKPVADLFLGYSKYWMRRLLPLVL